VKLTDGSEVDVMWSGVIKLSRKDQTVVSEPEGPNRKNVDDHLPKCPVCLRPSDAGNLRRLTCNCDTWYHADCLKQLLDKPDPRCPTCRKPQPNGKPDQIPSNGQAAPGHPSPGPRSDSDSESADYDSFDRYERVDPRDRLCRYGTWPHLICGPCPHCPNGPPPTPMQLNVGETCPWGPRLHHPPCRHYPTQNVDGSIFYSVDYRQPSRGHPPPRRNPSQPADIFSCFGPGPEFVVFY